MKLIELKNMLESLGFPVAYRAFVETEDSPVPPPPFIIYKFSYSDDMMADNHNYLDISNFQVELYTRFKDPEIETLIQNKFKEQEKPYIKTEYDLEEEGLLQILYEIQLIGG